MRPGSALFALLGSLLLLRLLWGSTTAPARRRLLVEKSREATHGIPVALRTLRSPGTPPPRATTNSTYLNKLLQPTERCTNLQDGFQTLSNKTKRYSEDDYLQIITNIQSCPWKRQVEEYKDFRAKLASCCDAVQNLIVSQNNTPVGTNMSYEVERKNAILIRKSIFNMFPVSQPFVERPYNQCAVVGNGGILNKSLCGAEIDKSDFVFRCNLPPTTGNVSKDVGSKTNLVTINPSIIRLKYGNLNEKKAVFLEDIEAYGDAFLLLPAFSFRANTFASFKVYSTLEESNARQKVIYFHPKYLRNLALFWRTKGVTEYRLSSGLMITSVAIELCENVKLYGFWPFSKTMQDTPVSHHYYDNSLPKRGFHEMPKEYSQILQLHMKGILKLQFSKCEIA
ncbi:alpha-2,8-sialyltransferase 8F [Myotis myotis]|uniref:ST8 alpha-N-acetyl-neuraminide alpha-2,8-sialyltransferase 6 n=1 Tax=Myotis myotis TaxID=51298 RepID=A0A7J8ARZ7_MYOMY|nr:alpha-2,8-sialyltransferase 8F [Myotis myotis]XP_036201756.1 alpha-2,8-sialyltransferase 8F [Myotis myotis]KAF6389071.1 ST8 alpha-N-acetyl-neuraminide alpha-2,8-sialyltransferase 6 [Myotis myotis]